MCPSKQSLLDVGCEEGKVHRQGSRQVWGCGAVISSPIFDVFLWVCSCGS